MITNFEMKTNRPVKAGGRGRVANRSLVIARFRLTPNHSVATTQVQT